MDAVLSSPRGFCAGVVRAIDIVELCLKQYGAPIYVRREIVHNPHVVADLQKKGTIFIHEIEDVPPGQTVVFSAHGVAPSVWAAAQARDLRIIDATCPLVTKVHSEAIKYAREGHTILLVGHRDHDEVIGTMGEVPDQTILVESVEEALAVEVPDPDRVVALTQTTLSIDDTKAILQALKGRFPSLVARNDICYATTNRQVAVKALADQVDLVLVIGAHNSSNCNRLREAAEAAGTPSYLVNGPEEIEEAWLEGAERIGVTSGASTPERLVEAIVERLQPHQVHTLEVMEENVSFILPRELRQKAVATRSPH